jgi:hypothetical protein
MEIDPVAHPAIAEMRNMNPNHAPRYFPMSIPPGGITVMWTVGPRSKSTMNLGFLPPPGGRILDGTRTTGGTAATKRDPSRYRLVEFNSRCRLGRTGATSHNVRSKVVLPPHGGARHPTKDCELSDMGQRVGDRTLEELFDGTLKGRVGAKDEVELLKAGEEARDLGLPRKGDRRAPMMLALAQPECPIEEISDMREDLCR